MSPQDKTTANGHDENAAAKSKSKSKRPIDPDETSKLLQMQARISQLELDQAGEKDQELEIEREVKRASRELHQQIAKLDTADKLEFVLKRCSELIAEVRRTSRENKTNKGRADNLQKEKDLNRAELSKTVGLKEKMEKLCRELQKDNNKVKSDLKAMQNTSKDRQESWDKKYTALLSKLEGVQEDKYNPRKDVLVQDIEEIMRQRFRSFIDQYELRELYFHSHMRTKELEVHYYMAQYEAQRKRAEEAESRIRELEVQVGGLEQTESNLRQELCVYAMKFQQVEDTLNSSSELFDSYKAEMQDMAKKSNSLQSENDELRRERDANSARVAWAERVQEFEWRESGSQAPDPRTQRQGRELGPNGVLDVGAGVNKPVATTKTPPAGAMFNGSCSRPDEWVRDGRGNSAAAAAAAVAAAAAANATNVIAAANATNIIAAANATNAIATANATNAIAIATANATNAIAPANATNAIANANANATNATAPAPASPPRQPVTFGPERPPPPAQQPRTPNGH